MALAHNPQIVSALLAVQNRRAAPQEKLIDQLNKYLEVVNSAANTSLLYVIDKNGFTIASSNWLSDASLVGNRYLFRPYFQDAMTGKEARYYAVGVTTNEAGYYFAQPIFWNEQILGVAVAKIEMESMQQQWQEKPEPSLLVDEQGVIIVSSNPEWRFLTTRIINEDDRTAFRAQRKYANHPLDPLQQKGSISNKHLSIGSHKYLLTQTNLPSQGWQLIQLNSSTAIHRAGFVAAAVTALLIGLSLLVYLYLRERQRKNQLSAAAQDARIMRTLNQQLEAEITERQKVENNLRDAQSELIQASKLAALGQMSAAIAHEVNQPLSAIRTFSASAKLLLDRNRNTEVHANLDEIKALTERLATLTADLKIFARKSDATREPVSLQKCLRSVHHLLESELQERCVTLKQSVPDQDVIVLANAIRIEQVFSNLLRNAIDASDSVEQGGIVLVTISVEDGDAVIRVQDNGSGLDAEALEHVFEPFFTTKPLGEGVGLGLAISYGIVEELGGQLRVRNSDEGGAMFSVRFAHHPP